MLLKCFVNKTILTLQSPSLPYRIYAIGDAVHGPMLAHKAEDEGISVYCIFVLKTSNELQSVDCVYRYHHSGRDVWICCTY